MELQALVAIPGHLGEDVNLLLKEAEDPKTLTPYIWIKGDGIMEADLFAIMADGIKVCESNTPAKAIKSLMAIFYVFNIAYPTKVTSTLSFIQKILLNVQDSTKKDKKVVKFLSTITK